MRKQYYFRPSPQGLQAWDVHQLIAHSRGRCRAPIAHVCMIQDADLSYPIILAANGDVMDGRHRLAKAALEGRTTIAAVRFDTDPPPDFVGRAPDDLPY